MTLQQKIKHYFKVEHQKARQRQNKALTKKWVHVKNWTYRLLFLGAIGLVAYSANNVYQTYQATRHWHKNTVLSLANQDPDILYDDSKTSKLAKQQFTKLAQSMIDSKSHALKQDATVKNIKKLNQYYKEIDNRTDYKPTLDEISGKVAIKNKYQALFVGNSTASSQLKASVTPMKIYQLNTDSYDNLFQWFINHNGEDTFVDQTMSLGKKLATDATVIDNMLSNVKSITTRISLTKFQLLPSAVNTTDLKYDDLKANLVYNWRSLTYLDNLTQTILPVLTKQTTIHTNYLNYEADMRAKADYEMKTQDLQRQYDNYIKVPDFVNQTKATVQKWCDKHHLSVNFETIETDKTAVGRVVKTSPDANGLLNRQDSLTVYIAKEKAPKVSSSSKSSSSSSSSESEKSSKSSDLPDADFSSSSSSSSAPEVSESSSSSYVESSESSSSSSSSAIDSNSSSSSSSSSSAPETAMPSQQNNSSKN